MRGKILVTVLVLLACTAAGMELSGNFSTLFSFGQPATWNALTLNFSFSGLQVQSSSVWQNLTLSQQTFVVSGSWGNFGVQAGLALKPQSTLRLDSLATQPFQVEGYFISLEISLGQLRLTLTINSNFSGP